MVFSYLVMGSERECFVVGGGGGMQFLNEQGGSLVAYVEEKGNNTHATWCFVTLCGLRSGDLCFVIKKKLLFYLRSRLIKTKLE